MQYLPGGRTGGWRGRAGRIDTWSRRGHPAGTGTDRGTCAGRIGRRHGGCLGRRVHEEPGGIAGRFGITAGKELPKRVVFAGAVAESDDEVVVVPIVGVPGVLHDLEAGQLFGIAGVGSDQVPRAVVDGDAEDGDVLVMLGNAQAAGRGELTVDQIDDAVVVGIVPAELEVGLGVVPGSGLDDAKLPPVPAQYLVDAEADRMADPRHLQGISVGTVDVGARPRLLVGRIVVAVLLHLFLFILFVPVRLLFVL